MKSKYSSAQQNNFSIQNFQHFYDNTYSYITWLTFGCYIIFFLLGFLIRTITIFNNSKKEEKENHT